MASIDIDLISSENEITVGSPHKEVTASEISEGTISRTKSEIAEMKAQLELRKKEQEQRSLETKEMEKKRQEEREKKVQEAIDREKKRKQEEDNRLDKKEQTEREAKKEVREMRDKYHQLEEKMIERDTALAMKDDELKEKDQQLAKYQKKIEELEKMLKNEQAEKEKLTKDLIASQTASASEVGNLDEAKQTVEQISKELEKQKEANKALKSSIATMQDHLPKSGSHRGWLMMAEENSKKWNKRFVVLNSNTLCYYKDDKKLDKPLEVVYLNECKVTKFEGREFSICICGPSKTAYLAAQGQAGLDSWLTAIEKGRSAFNM